TGPASTGREVLLPTTATGYSARAEVATKQLLCVVPTREHRPIMDADERKAMAGMRVLLCNPRGFCAGVNMAIDCVDQVLRVQGPPVYVFHEIVHNRHVVNRFVDRGVTFVDSVEEVPVGGTIVFSAHGVSPEVRQKAENRNLVQVDATCPLVAKV